MSKANYQFMHYEHYVLPYQRFGDGEELLFAFHGFGKSAADYEAYGATLGNKYTIIAFDFFYHGPHRTDLELELPPFTTSHLTAILEKMMWDNKRVNCSLLGYSLGGRLVLGLIHKMPNRILSVILVAPDGLRTGLMQRFVSGSRIGKKVGWNIVKNPSTSKKMAQWATQVGILPKKKGLFVISNLESKEFRLRAIRTWLTLKNYNLHLDLVIHYLNTRPIQFLMIFGKYDKIIPPTLGQKLIEKLNNKNCLIEIEAGHSLMYRVDEISKLIQEKIVAP